MNCTSRAILLKSKPLSRYCTRQTVRPELSLVSVFCLRVAQCLRLKPNSSKKVAASMARDGFLAKLGAQFSKRNKKERRHWGPPSKKFELFLCEVQSALERTLFVLDLLLKESDRIDQLLRTRWASGNIDIDRDHLIDALNQSVVVEDAS